MFIGEQHGTVIMTVRSERRATEVVSTWWCEQAACTCKWHGQPRMSATLARRDARRHVRIARGRTFKALVRKFFGLEPIGEYVMSSIETGEVVARLHSSDECHAWLDEHDQWVAAHSYRFVRKGV